MNADPAVMRHFPRPLDRAESDAIVERTEASFRERGYGLWAVERRVDGAFLGFTGLSFQTFEAPFTPCVEVGWRLRPTPGVTATRPRPAGRRFASASRRSDWPRSCPGRPCRTIPSIRVMERLGMHRDPADDFDNPRVPAGSPLRPHVLYRLRADEAG